MLPLDAQARKAIPIYSGFVKYFPRAIAAVAELSRKGNDQHNPGKELFWDRSKSGDEMDALMRHIVDGVTEPMDVDGVLHATKAAWRAMANLDKMLEQSDASDPSLDADGNCIGCEIEKAYPPADTVSKVEAGEYDEQCGDPTCWCNEKSLESAPEPTPPNVTISALSRCNHPNCWCRT